MKIDFNYWEVLNKAGLRINLFLDTLYYYEILQDIVELRSLQAL